MASASSSAPGITQYAQHGVAPLRAGQGSSFVLRRLHSLTGIIPVGAFLFEHILISNSTAITGPEAYARQVSFLANLPLVFFLELFGIWILLKPCSSSHRPATTEPSASGPSPPHPPPSAGRGGGAAHPEEPGVRRGASEFPGGLGVLRRVRRLGRSPTRRQAGVDADARLPRGPVFRASRRP